MISVEKIMGVVSLHILIAEAIDTFVLRYNYRGEGKHARCCGK